MAAFVDDFLSDAHDETIPHRAPSLAKAALFGAGVFAAVFIAAMSGTAFMITGGIGGGEPREDVRERVVQLAPQPLPAIDSVTYTDEAQRTRRSEAPSSVVFIPRARAGAEIETIGLTHGEDGGLGGRGIDETFSAEAAPGEDAAHAPGMAPDMDVAPQAEDGAL